jgi:hypothetical protein
VTRRRSFYFAALLSVAGSETGAQAAEGWTYTVIGTSSNADANAINDLGQVVYAMREPVAVGQERGVIRLTDGTTTATLYESPVYATGSTSFSVPYVDVNDAGQVVFSSGGGVLPAGLYRVVGGGAVAINPSPYTYYGNPSSAVLNASNQTVFVGLAGSGASLTDFRVVTANPDGTFADSPIFGAGVSGFSLPPRPTINSRADTAIVLYEQTASGDHVRFRLAHADTGIREDSLLVAGPAASGFGAPVLNDLRFGGVMTSDSGGSQRVFMVVPQGLSGLPAGVVEVAASGAYGFLSFGPAVAISDTNLVAFSGVRTHPDGSQREFIAVKDVGQEPVIVVDSFDTLGSGGPAIDLLDVHGSDGFVHSQAMNGRGEIVFNAYVGGVLSIVRATPDAGLVSSAPVLPAPEDVLPGDSGGWRFKVCSPRKCAAPGGSGSSRTWFFDPPAASGYVFESEDDTLRFASVVIPAPLSGGDGSFNVEFNGGSQPLTAGETFDFETFVPGGVDSFRITGIDLAANVDPADPAAFVTGLAFAAGAGDDAAFTMKPIVENTDDFDGDGVIASRDNCPLVFNADQADGDGDGVGTVCDNCPSIANPSQADGNGNGVGDVCEVPVVRMCSVDADGDIDRNDIALITAARNRPTSGANDPRDANSSGIIDVNDARMCTLRCDRASCAAE